jgi:archaemetzincin
MKGVIFSLCILTFSFCTKISKAPQKIGIQVLGDFEDELLDSIASSLQRNYPFEIIILPKQNLPKHTFINLKSPRYRADSLLYFLIKIKPDSIQYIMGLTNKDISTTKRNKDGKIKEPSYKYQDWGVFGLGFTPGKSCVISSYRAKISNKKLFNNRILKICTHEFGHNLGLHHCKSPKCVMQDAAETIKTIDLVENELCEKCKNQISHK